MYADGTTICSSKVIVNCGQKELGIKKLVSSFNIFSNLGLKFNTSKAQLVNICGRDSKNIKGCYILLDGNAITEVEWAQYLAVLN